MGTVGSTSWDRLHEEAGRWVMFETAAEATADKHVRTKRKYGLHKPSGDIYAFHTRLDMRGTLFFSLANPVIVLPGRLFYNLVVVPQRFFKSEEVQSTWKNRQIFTLAGLILDGAIARIVSMVRGFFLRLAIEVVAVWGIIGPYSNASMDARRAIGALESSINKGGDCDPKVNPLDELATSETFYLYRCCQKESQKRAAFVKANFQVVTIEGEPLNQQPGEAAVRQAS